MLIEDTEREQIQQSTQEPWKGKEIESCLCLGPGVFTEDADVFSGREEHRHRHSGVLQKPFMHWSQGPGESVSWETFRTTLPRHSLAVTYCGGRTKKSLSP